MIVCNQCKTKKSVEDYYARKDGTLRKTCKSCMNYKRRTYNVVKSMVGNARTRAKAKGMDFSIDVATVERLREEQGNICALTGWTLNWDHSFTGVQRKSPYDRASLDRIDSSKGYTEDNVQLVCDMANRIKSDYPLDMFFSMCEAVVTHKTVIKQ